MIIELPNILEVIEKVESVESSFNGKTQPIKRWIAEQREYINFNLDLIKRGDDSSDIQILLSLLRDYLVRAMTGEMGERTFNELRKIVKGKKDLTPENYHRALENARYRWGASNGAAVISDVVNYFGVKLGWKWNFYISKAEQYSSNNFLDDEILKINNISFKVRDLALSSFSPNYAAFDLHLSRVPTRIGLLNYGYGIEGNFIEMGNNPQNPKNYLFLHQLFHKLSRLSGGKYMLVDFDRLFWHLGRSTCGATPNCRECGICKICLTGKHFQVKADSFIK